MRTSSLLLVAAFLAAGPALPRGATAPAAASPGDRAPDPAAVAKYLSGLAKRRSLSKKDPDEIRSRLAALDEAGLLMVRDLLRGLDEKSRGAAAAEVISMAENALLVERWGEAVLGIPDVVTRMEDPTPKARAALLVDLSRLEDAEPATRFGLWAVESADLSLRLRAVDVLADLASFGGDPARVLPPVRRALEDPSAAVRDLALERLAEIPDPALLDWALEHCMDADSQTVEVREMEERRCPGERAFLLLARLSKSHTGIEPSEARALPTEKREAILADFRAWRTASGERSLREGDDGPFDPVPKVTTVIVPKDGTAEVAARWWSEVDRAAFRMTLEDLEVGASSTLDRNASWRMVVVASGARQGNWEAFVRRVRCGARHRLPRKGFALVETTIQPLLDGRIKVHVRSYESR